MSTSSKKPERPRGFRSISSASIDQRGVDHTKLAPGQKVPQVVVTQLIDEDGAHWQREGGGDYEFVGWAPELPKP